MEDRKAPCLIHFQNWFYFLRQQLQTKTKGELTCLGHEVSSHHEEHFLAFASHWNINLLKACTPVRTALSNEGIVMLVLTF